MWVLSWLQKSSGSKSPWVLRSCWPPLPLAILLRPLCGRSDAFQQVFYGGLYVEMLPFCIALRKCQVMSVTGIAQPVQEQPHGFAVAQALDGDSS